jgi:hypothetical protein
MHGAKPSRDSEPSQNFTSPGPLRLPGLLRLSMARQPLISVAGQPVPRRGQRAISRASPAARLSASLLPSEIVRIKPVQVEKFDRVVVTRRMQHHAVRCRPRLFVADIGVTHETDVVIDGSPPVRAVPTIAFGTVT